MEAGKSGKGKELEHTRFVCIRCHKQFMRKQGKTVVNTRSKKFLCARCTELLLYP